MQAYEWQRMVRDQTRVMKHSVAMLTRRGRHAIAQNKEMAQSEGGVFSPVLSYANNAFGASSSASLNSYVLAKKKCIR